MRDPMLLSVALGEVLDGWDCPQARHPVVRSGTRDPIPWLVRLSVARRDGFTCRSCGWLLLDMVGMEIDHILPWSAGGGDHSANLRTLCSPCNQKRSNYNDGAHEREMVPTTWWCQTCWLAPEDDRARGTRMSEYHAPDGDLFAPMALCGATVHTEPDGFLRMHQPGTEVTCGDCRARLLAPTTPTEREAD